MSDAVRRVSEIDTEIHSPKPGRVNAQVVLSGPGRPTVFEQLQAAWPASPPHEARVVSPFFDPPASVNAPAQRLWSLIRRRGEATIEYAVTVEDAGGATPTLFIHAPQSITRHTPTGRRNVQTMLYRLTDEPSRPLHAKCLWLEGERWAAHLIGSSNFTSAGFGLSHQRNYEANLLYLVDAHRDPKGYEALMLSRP